MGEALKDIWRNPYVRVVILLVIVYLVYLTLRFTMAAWLSFLVAYLIAYLLNPFVESLEKRNTPRWVGVAISMLGIIGLIVLASYLMGRVLIELGVFLEDIPALIRAVENLPRNVGRFLPEWSQNFVETALISLQVVLADFLATRGDGVGLIAGITSVVGGLFQAFVVIILAAYLLYAFPAVRMNIIHVIPPRYQGITREIAQKLDQSVGGYVRAQLLIALFVGVATGVSLNIVGIPLATPLGFVAGIGNLVPFLGPVLTTVPALILALPMGMQTVAFTGAAMLAVQQLDGNVLSPWILSRTTQIHPATVLVAILVGTSLLGLWGAIIGVPIAAFLKLLYTDYYLKSRWYRKAGTADEIYAGVGTDTPIKEIITK